ncbi:MAG: hypothetical protein ABII00_18485 [Elusimicrobiota bacterium]
MRVGGAFLCCAADLVDSTSLSPVDTEREGIFSEELARHAIGITDFTLPAIARWVCGSEGLRRSLHPFRNGQYLGSGSWEKVVEEGGLEGPSQLKAVLEWRRLVEA